MCNSRTSSFLLLSFYAPLSFPLLLSFSCFFCYIAIACLHNTYNMIFVNLFAELNFYMYLKAIKFIHYYQHQHQHTTPSLEKMKMKKKNNNHNHNHNHNNNDVVCIFISSNNKPNLIRIVRK